MKKLRVAAVLAATALALTGCATTPTAGGARDADAAATSAPSTAAPDPSEAEAEPSEEPTAEEAGPAKFGQTFTYEDGIEVTITAPKTFKPSQYAAGIEGPGTAVMFQITIKNGSTATFDPGLANVTVQSGEAEAESIYDSEKNLGGTPDTKVLAGKSVKYNAAFKVLNPKDIVVEFAPSWEHESQLFTNAAL